MAARAAAPKSAAAPLEISLEQRRNIIHQCMDKHYRRMLDQPVPMLGNRSPRNAVKTDAGRQKVVAWLKTLENHSANIVDPNDPMAARVGGISRIFYRCRPKTCWPMPSGKR